MNALLDFVLIKDVPWEPKKLSSEVGPTSLDGVQSDKKVNQILGYYHIASIT